jgi:large subunit ribosomal protein L5
MAKTASSSASAKATSDKSASAKSGYATLHDRLRGPIRDALKTELKITNAMALPRIEKVIVNVGINKSKMDSKELHEYIGESLGRITGAKPVFTRARIAISNFKTRKGLVVGAKVTLRGKRMEEFLDRLVSIALPRIRDFRGLPTRLDGHGNYAIGLKDHTIFPEIAPPEASKIFGMQIQISLRNANDASAAALLKHVGMPFKPSTKRLPDGKQVP